MPDLTTSRNLNNLLMGAQDPGTLLGAGRTQAANIAEAVPSSAYEKFGLALMQMLKQYQGLGTGKFVEAGLTGKEEAARRTMIEAEPGMPPSLQEQVRSADVAAMQPTITGAEEMRKTFLEQIQGLGSVLEQSQAIGKWMQESARQKQQDALNLVLKIPSAVKALDDKTKRDIEKSAGLQSGLIDLIPEEEKWVQTTLSDGSLAQKNTKTGEIKILVKAPSAVGKQLPPNQVVMLSDAKFLPSELSKIQNIITNQPKLFGWIVGRLPRDAQLKADAELRKVAQLVGKFMEGGVLRKEDEEKYRKMLPQLNDKNPSVAQSKLDSVKNMLQDKYEEYLSDFGNAGYDVSGFTGINLGESSQSQEIPVINLQTQETGWIPVSEFDPSIYQLIQQ